MKAIYRFNDQRVFINSDIVDDDYQLKNNETLIAPAAGLCEPIILPIGTTAWVGTDEAVWQAAQENKTINLLKEHSQLVLQPTAEQQQLAELIKSNAQQMALNAHLIKSITALQK